MQLRTAALEAENAELRLQLVELDKSAQAAHEQLLSTCAWQHVHMYLTHTAHHGHHQDSATHESTI